MVRESAPTTTPPLNATAMMDVCRCARQLPFLELSGSLCKTHAEIDLARLEVRDLGRERGRGSRVVAHFWSVSSGANGSAGGRRGYRGLWRVPRVWSEAGSVERVRGTKATSASLGGAQVDDASARPFASANTPAALASTQSRLAPATRSTITTPAPATARAKRPRASSPPLPTSKRATVDLADLHISSPLMSNPQATKLHTDLVQEWGKGDKADGAKVTSLLSQLKVSFWRTCDRCTCFRESLALRESFDGIAGTQRRLPWRPRQPEWPPRRHRRCRAGGARCVRLDL